MNVNEALHIIANGIWKHGEIYNGEGCLCPSGIVARVTDYHRASDILIDKLNVTHYSRMWNKRGKTVKLRWYRAEEFGATVIRDEHFVVQQIIELD